MATRENQIQLGTFHELKAHAEFLADLDAHETMVMTDEEVEREFRALEPSAIGASRREQRTSELPPGARLAEVRALMSAVGELTDADAVSVTLMSDADVRVEFARLDMKGISRDRRQPVAVVSRGGIGRLARPAQVSLLTAALGTVAVVSVALLAIAVFAGGLPAVSRTISLAFNTGETAAPVEIRAPRIELKQYSSSAPLDVPRRSVGGPLVEFGDVPMLASPGAPPKPLPMPLASVDVAQVVGTPPKAIDPPRSLAPAELVTVEGAGPAPGDATGVKPLVVYPITSNDTPYSQCLRKLQTVPASNLPVFAVGEIADKTGQVQYYDKAGNNLTQGAAEMVMSALYKTGKAHLVERYDLRIPLTEVKLAENGLNRSVDAFGKLPSTDFILVGALTELNYNIVSGGAGFRVAGVGGGTRTAVVNVALDLRVIDSKNFAVSYVSSLQKQIYGYEVEADVFRFWDSTLVELEAGHVRNEPLQLGVRSVAEMAVYQIMTDFLRLPRDPSCSLVENDHTSSYPDQLKPNGETK